MKRVGPSLLIACLLAPGAYGQETAVEAHDPAAVISWAEIEGGKGKGGVYGADRLAALIAPGRRMIPALVSEVRENPQNGLLLDALGLLASESDSDAVDALKRIAFQYPYHLAAGGALLRIGGGPARAVLDHVSESDIAPENFNKLLETVWTLPRSEDLAYAKSVFSRMAEEHPESGIRVQARDYGARRIETVLELQKHRTSRETGKQLAEMVTGTHPVFVSVAGGVAQDWALDMIVKWHLASAVPALRTWASTAEAKGNDVRYKRLILAIQTLGGNLTAQEESITQNEPFRPVCDLVFLNLGDQDVLSGREGALERLKQTYERLHPVGGK